jgi:hypothetical protein
VQEIVMSDDRTAPDVAPLPDDEIREKVRNFSGVEGEPTVGRSGGRTIVDCKRRSAGELQSIEIELYFDGKPPRRGWRAVARNKCDSRKKTQPVCMATFGTALAYIGQRWNELDLLR